MRDLRKEIKHALKTAVLLVAILMTTAGAVGTAYADDNSTLGVTTRIVTKSDNEVFRHPAFDDDLFFRPRFVDPFFRPIVFFNPFFDFEDDFEDEKFNFDRFDRFDREDD